MVPHAHQTILFDLGGVLVEIDSVAALQRMFGQQLPLDISFAVFPILGK
jgi:hypothetical protein